MTDYTYRIWHDGTLAACFAFLIAHLQLTGNPSKIALAGSAAMLGFLVLDRLGEKPSREVYEHE